MRTGKLLGSLLLAAVALNAAGCGYRVVGRGPENGAGRVLAVPVLANRTNEYGIEQRLTEALRRALIERTNYRVMPSSAGDVLLTGEVLSLTSFPVIFSGGRGTAYTVAVDISLRMSDTADGAVLFQAERWTFREVFELANDSAEFVPEDNAAIDRLARQFAASLVAALYHSSP